MPDEKHIFDLSRCPHPMSEEFVLMDDELFYECDRFEEYTQRATAAPKGQKIDSDIPCECVTNQGDYCKGTVQLKRLDVPKEIRWECQKCCDQGAIINFEGTYWDKSKLSAEEKEQLLNQDYDDLFAVEGSDSDPWGDPSLADELDLMFQKMGEEELQEMSGLLLHRTYPQLFEETIGLSEDALFQLITGNWKDPGAALHVRDDISFEEARQSLFFHNARSFLQLLAEQKSFTATKTGNLKRKTIKKLIDVCRWPDGYLQKIHEFNKVINEPDIWLLHAIRILMDLAGLIRKEKGAFLPVKKRLHLTQKEHAGELYQLLFCTYFRKMNMAYRGSDYAAYLQDILPYSLFRLHQRPTEWSSPEELFELMLLPADRLISEKNYEASGYNPNISTLEYDLLRPLAHFGIMEESHTGEKDRFGLRENREFRKTPLFDKLIAFNMP